MEKPDFSPIFPGNVDSAMKAPNYIIQIDAREAYKRIGVHVDASPIGAQCVESLRNQLQKLVTQDLLIASLKDATKHRKPRSGRMPTPPSALGTNTGEEGCRHEA